MTSIFDLKETINHLKMLRKLDTNTKEKLYDIAIDSLEIQIPKHPISCFDNDYGSDADGNRGIRIEWVECPNCGNELDGEYQSSRCPECKQLLDWCSE